MFYTLNVSRKLLTPYRYGQKALTSKDVVTNFHNLVGDTDARLWYTRYGIIEVVVVANLTAGLPCPFIPRTVVNTSVAVAVPTLRSAFLHIHPICRRTYAVFVGAKQRIAKVDIGAFGIKPYIPKGPLALPVRPNPVVYPFCATKAIVAFTSAYGRSCSDDGNEKSESNGNYHSSYKIWLK
jgi:hypothetical protein